MNPDQRLPAIFSLVMIMATATLGWMSLRPGGLAGFAARQSAAQVPADHQLVVARLWEDPLQAIQADVARNAATGAHPTVDRVEQSVREAVATQPVSVLVVPIPATPFPGDLEARLRTRYSIQMALSDQNYAPKNGNYLGYFKLSVTTDPPPADGPPVELLPAGLQPPNAQPDDDAERARPKEESVYVPYEWFSKRDGGRTALVLWLPEIHLNREPLERLAALTGRLITESSKKQFQGLFVIGPRSSDTLKALIPKSDSAVLKNLQGKFSIFSPQATAPDALIGIKPGSVPRRNLALQMQENFGAPEAGWDYLHNYIPTDDQLTDRLVAELALRGVRLGESTTDQDRILIFAEADTSYGRSLPRAVAESLRRHRAAVEASKSKVPATASTPAKKAASGDLDSQLFIYRYLRGLDQQKGQQSSDTGGSRSAAKSPDEALAEVLSQKRALALGESQLDYVDRILGDLEGQDEPTGHQEMPDERPVRAVGVLGGDVYDKLILLRALRDKYPNAVFFTTDLDARMWHPDHLPFTRNLIVASGYGVNAPAGTDTKAAARLRIPPFRDVYQVAVFEACRAALMKSEDHKWKVDPELSPAIFEIGRNGPLELLAPKAPQEAERGWVTLRKAALNLGAPKLSSGETTGLVLVTLGLLLGGGILWSSLPRRDVLRLFFTRERRWIGFVLIGAALVLAWAYSAMQYIAAQPGGERWVRGEGISIWPTEMLRLIIAMAVVVLMVMAYNHRDRVRAGIGAAYFPGTAHDPGVGDDTNEDASSPAEQSALAAYNRYLKKASWRNRFLRVTALTIAYLMLGFGAMYWVEGGSPFLGHIRGNAARLLDFGLMLVSITAFIWLLFFVLDAAWITSQLLLAMSKNDTAWPEALLARKREEFGVNDRDLAGYLDVQFAAEKSRDVGRLIVLPFAIQLLFIISRSTYFDRWSWPSALIGIFLCNFFLAWSAWAILRRAARKIRADALGKVQGEIDEIVLGVNTAPAEAVAVADEARQGVPSPRRRLRRLEFLKEKIMNERRGAYSRTFQDPALIATVLPTGIFGILAVLFRAFFG